MIFKKKKAYIEGVHTVKVFRYDIMEGDEKIGTIVPIIPKIGLVFKTGVRVQWYDTKGTEKLKYSENPQGWAVNCFYPSGKRETFMFKRLRSLKRIVPQKWDRDNRTWRW